MSDTHHIVIAGAGGIGRAVALLLGAWSDFDVVLSIGDAHQDRADEAAEWLRHGFEDEVEVRPFLLPASGTSSDFDQALEGGAILLDCLPGSQAPRMARAARDNGLHYANLTEYVAETRQVQEIAEGAETGFLLQTGLAPGFINVLGHKLFLDFCEDHGVDTVHSLRMRVGALPVVALPPHFYGFTWSPVGVATEYLKDAEVVRNGKTTSVPSLTEVRTVRLGALQLEEGLTSGGAADLPTALAGRVNQLDYKTLRHPGHFAWVRDQIETLPGGDDRVQGLQGAMERLIPAVEEDQVVIYAAVEGFDQHGVRRREEECLVVEPCEAGRHTLKAIQSTTAAGLAESARLLLEGDYRGVVLQSQIDPDDFLEGPFVSRAYYDEY